jgi:Glycosyltransferases, probably involved in cell wall biogenesis
MKYTKLTVYIILYIFTIAIVISSIVLTPHPLDSPLIRVIRVVIVGFASVLLTKYTIYMVLAPWYSLFAKRDKKLVDHFVKDYRPLVSVMIPAWNESVGLRSTVKSLLSSTYKNLEIIVINDGSTDDSDALMRRFIDKYDKEMQNVPENQKISIVYYYQQNGGKGNALNTAIALSHGDILLSVDADCVVNQNCVAAFVEAFKDPRTMAAVGNVRIGNAKTLVGTIQYLEFLFSFYFKKSDSLLNTIYIIGGAAGAFRREVFDKLGGYNCANITEDIELSVRIQAQGWKIVYCPDALIFTEGASTLQGLMKQRLRWKRGRFQTFWEHRYLFFSLDPKHNKLLTWFVLPLAFFGDVQLGFELLFIAILFLFSFISSDFSAFLSGVIVVSMMFAIQSWDCKEEHNKSFLLLAPIGWLLFYVSTFVELYALIKSIWLIIRRKEAAWQRWQRSGAIDK